jgi:hypothetical protein
LFALSRSGGALGGGASGGARDVTRRPGFEMQGDLGCFPPPLLFQMMQLAGVDGLLTLRAPHSTCQVWFQRGRLVFARGGGQTGTLGEELVRRGLLDRDACEAAAAARRGRRSGPRIGTILVERGAIQRDDLESVLRERIKAAIVDAVEWSEGRFTFEAGAQALDEDVLLDVGLESLLLECMTRLDHARRSPEAGERGES